MKPWMSDSEIQIINKYLTPNTVMLEWGSGGSTCTFSKLVKEYYSIEHIEEWYNKVTKYLQDKPYRQKISYFHIKPDFPRTIPTQYKEFKSYIEFVDILNIKYDIVLIDGRARVDCAKYVTKYLNENATVFIHDYFARPQYHILEDIYTVVESEKSGQSIVGFKLKK